jgi:hypothetical protein
MRAEPARTRNQSDKKGRGRMKRDFEKNRQQNSFIEALEDVTGEETCEHTPDKLIPANTDYEEDRIIQRFQCTCGKNVQEIFTLSKTTIS